MRTCTICTHPERASLDAAIAAGTSYRVIARQFSVGHDAVQRHASDHIAESIKQSQIAKDEAQALDVVKQLKTINSVTLAILQEARKDKKQNGLALQAIDRVCRQIELQAKLLGAIDTPQVNIAITPEWHAIRTTIIAALTPYPDARIAVASALATMEAGRDRFN